MCVCVCVCVCGCVCVCSIRAEIGGRSVNRWGVATNLKSCQRSCSHETQLSHFMKTLLGTTTQNN